VHAGRQRRLSSTSRSAAGGKYAGRPLEIRIKNIAGNVRSSFRQNITLISALY
jgi:hypothetical protein